MGGAPASGSSMGGAPTSGSSMGGAPASGSSTSGSDSYAGYRREPGVHPPLVAPLYRSTARRALSRPLVVLPHLLTEVTGPLLGPGRVQPGDADLTRQAEVEPVGQRITVTGRVLDTDGRPVPDALVEVWQANAAGRYRHASDTWPAPLDPAPGRRRLRL